MNGKNGGSRFQEAESSGNAFQQGWCEFENKMNETIQSHPASSLLIGMGAGLVTGMLIAQMLRSNSHQPQSVNNHFESAKQISQNVLDTVRKSLSDAFSHLS